MDTLYLEAWAAGLDTSGWQAFGIPKPRVVWRSPLGQGPAFANAGDYNHLSGAVSKASFSLADGLSLEVDAWLGFTGTHWQDWNAALLADTLRLINEEGSYHGGLLVLFGLMGPNPTGAGTNYTACESRGEWDQTKLAWLTRQWHRVAIQLRPDGVAECFMDGILMGSQELRPDLTKRRFSIVLAGRMENTAIYHGRVLVTRGLRH
ncbi:MAG: hypothetical protein ACT4P6_13635 [Gemmatimonadaceae bacterium]